MIHDSLRKRYQCKNCRHQATLRAGTIFETNKLALTLWFQEVYIISQAKTGLSALALKRQLGISYHTAWMIHHKSMHAMRRRDGRYLLAGMVQIDDACFGGKLSGAKTDLGSENKAPFVAAVELNGARQPIRMKMSRVSGFTASAISNWAKEHVAAGSTVIPDGLACFAGVIEAGCKHIAKIAGGRKP